MIDISVIVPVYNAEQYLSKCFDSILNQTIKNFEIIVINDGSTDNSLKIIQEYHQKYPEVIKVIDQKNMGQAIARNNGINKAFGNYICFVDSDDWISNVYLEKLYNKAIKDSLDIVICDAYIIVDDYIKKMNVNVIKTGNLIKDYILNTSSPCWKIIKKDIIVKNKLLFSEGHIYEDLATVPLYGLLTKKIGFIDDNLYYYLVHSGSTMNQITYNPKLEDIFVAFEKLEYKFKILDFNNAYEEELEYIYIKHLLHAASLRFIKFPNYQQNIERIIKIMNNKFPNWKKNKYFKLSDFKYKVICILIYMRKYWLLNAIVSR